MPYCINCGAKIPDEAKFCPECGEPAIAASNIAISHNAPSNEETAIEKPTAVPMDKNEDKPKKKKKTGIIIFSVILVALAAAFLAFSVWNKTDGPISKIRAFDMAKTIVKAKMDSAYNKQFCGIKDARISIDENGYYIVSGWAYEKGADPVRNRILWAVSFVPMREYDARLKKYNSYLSKDTLTYTEEIERDILKEQLTLMELKDDKGDWCYTDEICLIK